MRASGHVGSLVAAHSDTAGDRGDEVIGLRVPRVSGSGPVRKRFRLNRKTPAHVAGLFILVHVFGRDCVMLDFSGISMPDHTRRRCDQAQEESTPAQDRTGVVTPWDCAGPRLRPARLFD